MYEMLMADLTDQIAQATADSTQKSDFKAMTLGKKAEAEGDVVDTTNTMNADQKYLDDLTASCTQKSSDFENRQQLRAEEIVALKKAIEILAGGAVSGAAGKHLPSMIQKAHSLAQLRSGSVSPQNAVAAYLQKRATELNSRVLSTLAV